MKKFKFSSKRGFTLIELLVVIGILAVLAAIAIPSVAGLIDRANVSADKTNSNEMTNSMERFASEYELYCQDIAAGKIKNTANLDGAQGRVYNVTKATTRGDIEKLESEEGFNGRAIDGDTNYPINVETARAIVQVYAKTSSSTFEPKQSDAHYYYSPDCGVVVAQDTAKSDVASLNALVPSGLDASGKKLHSETLWIDLTAGEDVKVEATTYYTMAEINADKYLYAIGKTKKEYVVAKFNEDFTEVVITKNGDDSDGLMKDYNSGAGYASPMREKTTLQKAIIKEGIVNISIYSFYECKNLAEVILPNSLREIDNFAFSYSFIRTLTLPKGVCTVGLSAFSNCTNLTSVVIENGLTYLSTNMFMSCVNLQSLSLPNSLTKIENSAVSNCKNLKSITIPENVKSVGQAAFFQCKNLEQITILGSVSEMGMNAFSYSDKLSVVTIKEGTTYIGQSAFYWSNSLKTVYLPKTITSVEKSAFHTIGYGSTIYCETQEVANLLNENNISTSITKVIVDPNKF